MSSGGSNANPARSDEGGMRQPTAGEIKQMKSSMGLDDLEDLKKRRKNSGLSPLISCHATS